MTRKSKLDTFGAVSLTGFAALLAFNQVVIKLTNEGFQPVFFAGLRSVGAVFCIYAWMRFRGLSVRISRETIPAAIMIGLIFGLEFIFLFVSLDLTTVTRSVVIFYSMPVWLALMAHVAIPGERLTWRKSIGLAVALVGVSWAILDRGTGADAASLAGDLCALGAAICWAGIAICAKATKLAQTRPEVQLFYQVLISIPVLLIASLFFGPFLRDPQPLHYAGLAFQIIVIVTMGFMFWLWLLSIYPSSTVASFSFLTPVFGVFLGWALLSEPVGVSIFGALILVTLGIILINRAPNPQVPQKV
jgi:drug/metabolite transporter (DMT)-like permease